MVLSTFYPSCRLSQGIKRRPLRKQEGHDLWDGPKGRQIRNVFRLFGQIKSLALTSLSTSAVKARKCSDQAPK